MRYNPVLGVGEIESHGRKFILRKEGITIEVYFEDKNVASISRMSAESGWIYVHGAYVAVYEGNIVKAFI